MTNRKPAKSSGSGSSLEDSYIGCSEKERRIYIRGYIDDAISLHFATYFDQMRGRDPILIDITSGGGDVRSALDMYNRIRNSEGQVITVTFGGVTSASLLVFLAADERWAAADSLLRFHWPVWYSSGDIQDTPDTFGDKNYFSKKMFNLLIKIIVERTDIPRRKVVHYSRHMIAFTGREAHQAGIITEVFDSKESLAKAGAKFLKQAVKTKKARK